MDGVLVIDKPAGMTSHDVVDEVRSRLGTRRVGHGGTLDPLATGVLLLGVGRATRFLSYVQGAPKRYRAVARFGITTLTQDAAGEVLDVRPASFARADLLDALRGLTGEVEQVPPMVSAIKVGGERLYAKARRGEEIERTPRRVTVHDLVLLDFTPRPSPEATLDVRCSGGTYVRTLVHDLGERLGCGAHLAALRRTEAGGFDERDALELTNVDPGALRPLVDAVRELPHVELASDLAALVAHGRPIELGHASVSDGEPAALLHEGRLLGVYRRRGERLVPDRVVGS